MAPPTPLRENSCPRPPPAPEGVVISEVASGHWTNHSQQRAFVELHGHPMTDLRGLVLTVFDQQRSGTVIALPLTGSIDSDGFYIVGNVTGAGEGSRRPCCSGIDDWTLEVKQKIFYLILNNNPSPTLSLCPFPLFFFSCFVPIPTVSHYLPSPLSPA